MKVHCLSNVDLCQFAYIQSEASKMDSVILSILGFDFHFTQNSKNRHRVKNYLRGCLILVFAEHTTNCNIIPKITVKEGTIRNALGRSEWFLLQYLSFSTVIGKIVIILPLFLLSAGPY